MKQSKPVTITGWVITGLVGAFMLFGAVMKLLKPDAVIEEFARLGYPDSTITPLAITEIACAILFLIPRTAPLGAILLTGYLGGAIATHVRAGDGQFYMPALIAVVAWIALYLRMPKLRALVSILKPLSSSN
jgi:uncharacterized membrane protein YphA (DoxX/SURF4 family)